MGWNPAAHPRVPHGHGGGEFAREQPRPEAAHMAGLTAQMPGKGQNPIDAFEAGQWGSALLNMLDSGETGPDNLHSLSDHLAHTHPVSPAHAHTRDAANALAAQDPAETHRKLLAAASALPPGPERDRVLAHAARVAEQWRAGHKLDGGGGPVTGHGGFTDYSAKRRRTVDNWTRRQMSALGLRAGALIRTAPDPPDVSDGAEPLTAQWLHVGAAANRRLDGHVVRATDAAGLQFEGRFDFARGTVRPPGSVDAIPARRIWHDGTGKILERGMHTGLWVPAGHASDLDGIQVYGRTGPGQVVKGTYEHPATVRAADGVHQVAQVHRAQPVDLRYTEGQP
jgi:hypothetical protein